MLRILGRITSANVQKVTWLCDECDIAYERQDVDQKAQEYKRLNPNAKIPTIVDDGFVLWESHAILQYLCTKHKLSTWYPTDLKSAARARQWMDWAHCESYRAAEMVWIGFVKPEYWPGGGKPDMAAVEKARVGWSKKIAMLDGHLAGSKYVAGDTINIGDMPLAILTFRWFGIPMERENYPNLKRWYDSIAVRPAFQTNVIDTGIR